MSHIELVLPSQTAPKTPFEVKVHIVDAPAISGYTISQHGIQLLQPFHLSLESDSLHLQLEADQGTLHLSVTLADGEQLTADVYAIASDQGVYVSDHSLEAACQLRDQAELSPMEYLLRYSADAEPEPDVQPCAPASAPRPSGIMSSFFSVVEPQPAAKPRPMMASFFSAPVAETRCAPAEPIEPEPQVITISGHLTWIDIEGNEHPLSDTLLELRTMKGTPVSCYSDAQGNYTIQSQPITAADTFYLFLYSETPFCRVSGQQNATSAHSVLLRSFRNAAPGETFEHEDKVIDCNQKSLTKSNLNIYRSFQIAQAIHIGHNYVHALDGEHEAHDVTQLFYPNGRADRTSFCSTEGGFLSIYDTAFCAWDILLHEFGHWLQFRYGFLDTPGGAHASNADDIERQGDKDAGIRQAWCESWPTVFAIMSTRYLQLEGLPFINDLNYDANNQEDDEFWNYSLADEDRYRLGEGCERSIMKVLFEMHESDIAHDHHHQSGGLHLSDASLWQYVTHSKATTFSQFIAYALSQGVDALALGPILSGHGMSARDLLVSADHRTLTFTPGGNPACELSRQNQATLHVLHPVTHQLLAQLPAVIDQQRGSVDLSSLDWPSEGLAFQLYCSQTCPPLTGPYPSELLVVANPPATAPVPVPEASASGPSSAPVPEASASAPSPKKLKKKPQKSKSKKKSKKKK